MKFIYLHPYNGVGYNYLINPAHIVAIVKSEEDEFTSVYLDCQDEEIRDIMVIESPEGIRKMIEANEP